MMDYFEIGQWLFIWFLIYRMGVNDGRWRATKRMKRDD